MKKIIAVLGLMLAVASCRQGKVDEFGAIEKEGAATVQEKPKEAPKETSGFKEGRVVMSLLVGKFTTSSAGYAEIKQEGNKLFLRLGEVSYKDFEKAFEKDTSLSYRKTNPLSGDLSVDVYKDWLELNPIIIDEKEYLKIGNMDIYIYQDSEVGFVLYGLNSDGKLAELPFRFWKGDIKDYPKMNDIKYNMIDKITDLQFFE